MTDTIFTTRDPDAIKAVVHHHDAYYRTHWHFDDRFKKQVHRELAAFIDTYAPEHDGFWWAAKAGNFAGAVVVDGTVTGDDGARIRWFIVPEQYQGHGVGARLFEAAMAFCREKKFSTVHLWTFKGLDAARVLYERNGFRLVEETPHDGWGAAITAQRFELIL